MNQTMTHGRNQTMTIARHGLPRQAGTAWAERAWAGLPDALRAEWTKLRTVPGTAWILTAICVLTVAVGAATAAATRCGAGTRCVIDPTRVSLTGIEAGQAVVAILAVLAYRLVNFWIPIPVGGAAYASLQWRRGHVTTAGTPGAIDLAPDV